MNLFRSLLRPTLAGFTLLLCSAAFNAHAVTTENTTSTPAVAAPALAPTPAKIMPVMHDLSPFGMYQNADAVVKSVMVGLLLASVLTWTIWLAKGVELLRARRQLNRELATLRGLASLDSAAERTKNPIASATNSSKKHAMNWRFPPDYPTKMASKSVLVFA